MAEIFQTTLNTFLSIFKNDFFKTLIIFLLIPLIIRFIENRYFTDIALKKNVWINFIYKNRSIEECYSKYNEVKKKSEIGLLYIYLALAFYLALMFIAALSSVLFPMLILSDPEKNIFLIQYQITSQNLFTFLYLIILLLYSLGLVMYWKQFYIHFGNIKESDIFKNFIILKKRMFNIGIFSFLLIFSAINMLTIDYTNIIIFDIFIYLIIFIISVISITVMYLLFSSGRDFNQRLKNKINNDYSKYFPFLRVSTIGGEYIVGKLENIFNRESIVLINDRTRITIMWSSVATLREETRFLSHKQQQLSNFFNKI